MKPTYVYLSRGVEPEAYVLHTDENLRYMLHKGMVDAVGGVSRMIEEMLKDDYDWSHMQPIGDTPIPVEDEVQWSYE